MMNIGTGGWNCCGCVYRRKGRYTADKEIRVSAGKSVNRVLRTIWQSPCESKVRELNIHKEVYK